MRTIGFFVVALSWSVQPMATYLALGQDEKIEHPEAKAVAGTPDGKLWISANKDIRVWDVATGRLVKTIVPDEPQESLRV